MENKEFYNEYIKQFLEENSKVNLISKNDEKFIWEKHIYDSLAAEKFFTKYGYPKNLLDIGTGGGFPSVPIALTYQQIHVTAVDSIAKKIRAIQSLKSALNIENITPICSRIENLSGEFEVVTSRAVSSLKNICEYALPKTCKNGYFIAYKSRKTPDEILEAEKTLKKYNAKIIDIIEYELPLEEKLTRNLIIIKRG